MVQEASEEQLAACRNRIAGFDYLHKKGFDSLRSKTGEIEDIKGGTHGKGSKWNRESTRGVYGVISKKTAANCPPEDCRFCVIVTLDR